jgi:hypothetical protein
VKFYYLTQLGFWCHQVLLLNAEAWRKDHIQMMSHHIITISLVTASYWYNFTRVGVLIMVLMDWCDIFLAVGCVIFILPVVTGLIYCPNLVHENVSISQATRRGSNHILCHLCSFLGHDSTYTIFLRHILCIRT